MKYLMILLDSTDVTFDEEFWNNYLNNGNESEGLGNMTSFCKDQLESLSMMLNRDSIVENLLPENSQGKD